VSPELTVEASPDGAAARSARRWRPRRSRVLAGVALVLVTAGVVVAARNPFSGNGPSGSLSDNSTATSLQTVARRPLSSQTQVDGTLGYAVYAGSSSVAVPSGTAPADVQHAQQTVTSAQATLQAAQTALAADQRALAQAQAMLAADRLKVRSVCGGDNAASASDSNASGSNQNPGSGSSPCQSAAQAVTSDQQSVSTAEGKVSADQGQVASAQASLSAAEQSLSTANSSATVYDPGATYTMLPDPGTVVRRGQALYAVNGQPVLLLYGPVAAWRAFRAGMSPGRDVAELNANLDALGYAERLAGDAFTSATAQAIDALQQAHGLDQTGQLPLGSVVFEPGPVRVTSVTPTVGATVQAGAVLSVTSTHHQVAIDLDASQQSEVKVGDPVTITLPDNSTTPGVVSKVGKVATTPSSDQSGGGSSTPTIEVDVKLSHERAAGQLDQAPVQVSITTASVKSALVVPVNALLALAGGGYAVEVVDPSGARHLVAVTTGLFDDAEGLVQVSGAGLKAGQRVVVPSS
jgi:multidrug resistance efflux pump